MTFQESFILEKLNTISEYTEEINHLFRFSVKEILNDSEKMHIAERLCQLIVDAMIDINQHFIKELNLKISDDLQGTFYILGENNVLPKNFALKIAPVVGIRNRLVHKYDELSPKIFIESLYKDRNDFDLYAKYINEYLIKISN
ncbi:MAG: DUF86 domain-containing protein [Candidatus Pacebacteria bacterium]|nr:DUF86 domain-containing protein [Candidatus Paceibacterota bacterium]